jgi:hypothetical protein
MARKFRKQKMEEKVNVKMMELTTQNKEMKGKLMEKKTKQKEW